MTNLIEHCIPQSWRHNYVLDDGERELAVVLLHGVPAHKYIHDKPISYTKAACCRTVTIDLQTNGAVDVACLLTIDEAA